MLNTSSNQSMSECRPERGLSDPKNMPTMADRTIDQGQDLRPDAGDSDPLMSHKKEHNIRAHPDDGLGTITCKMRQPLRSSIACLRCRRSKIKCDNNGCNSPCENCVRGKHHCQYPEALAPPPGRPELVVLKKQNQDSSHEKRRKRKADESPTPNRYEAVSEADEILAYSFLTGELWDQLFNIYKQHFATELPFVHTPTLKEKIGSMREHKGKRSPELDLVLLGILTLTARFHVDLVRYVSHLHAPQGRSTRWRISQSQPNSMVASDFFADALTSALGPLSTAMSVITVERVQAFLILALFEWIQNKAFDSSSAWMYLGTAIRMAKLLNLEMDDERMRSLEGCRQGLQQRPTWLSEIAIIRETRRRTMYSCFILERMMVYGSGGRTLSIAIETMRIQLPCSEVAFDLSLDVCTGSLRKSGGLSPRQTNDDSTLSRFIKLVEVWEEISRYTFTGGRTQEIMLLWDSRSTFQRLRKKLDNFHQVLPETFTLSRQNYYRHNNHQAGTTYVSLHVLFSVCQIILNRECLPFLPLRCCRPQGPLDFSESASHQAPNNFWEESADDVFRAARDIIDLVAVCGDKLHLSPLVTFSIWLAGFMKIYSQHFPHMDSRQRMTDTDEMQQNASGSMNALEELAGRMTVQTLRKAATYLPGAQDYLENLEMMNQYFAKARNHVPIQSTTSNPAFGPSGECRPFSILLCGDMRGAGKRCEIRGLLSHDEQCSHHNDRFSSHHDNRELRDSMEPLDTLINNTSSARTPVITKNSSGLPTPLEGCYKVDTATVKSQLLLPGIDQEILERAVPEFTEGNTQEIESKRMGEMLNDLEALSGSGSLCSAFRQ